MTTTKLEKAIAITADPKYRVTKTTYYSEPGCEITSMTQLGGLTQERFLKELARPALTEIWNGRITKVWKRTGFKMAYELR